MLDNNRMASISYLLQESFPDCSPSEQQAAQFILERPAQAMRCNISELAEQAQVSTAAIIRLCKRLHIDGFNNLKLMLAEDVYSPEAAADFLPDFNFKSDSPLETISATLIQTAINNFNNVGKLLNEKTLFNTIALILKASSIQIVGI